MRDKCHCALIRHITADKLIRHKTKFLSFPIRLGANSPTSWHSLLTLIPRPILFIPMPLENIVEPRIPPTLSRPYLQKYRNPSARYVKQTLAKSWVNDCSRKPSGDKKSCEFSSTSIGGSLASRYIVELNSCFHILNDLPFFPNKKHCKHDFHISPPPLRSRNNDSPSISDVGISQIKIIHLKGQMIYLPTAVFS